MHFSKEHTSSYIVHLFGVLPLAPVTKVTVFHLYLMEAADLQVWTTFP